jgi:hypothetical protein
MTLNLRVANANFYSTGNRTLYTFNNFVNIVEDLLIGHNFFYRLSHNRSLTHSKAGAVMLSIHAKQWTPLTN